MLLDVACAVFPLFIVIKEDGMEKKGLSAYWPLVCLVGVAALAASALYGSLGTTGRDWMHLFMGVFLTQFAMLKLFDISGFAEGFQRYDLVAQRSREYALAYPFIELLLGLLYVSFFLPVLTYVLTIIVMTVGSVGVFSALWRGLDVRCACMGTVLSVPLSTVTVVEDVGMGLMALAMLLTL